MQVYFLCTGNACRSQMAEGWAKALHPDWVVQSAGTHPTALDPRATLVMQQAGIDVSAQFAKPIDPAFLAGCDLVVTLCGDARDHCPVVPGKAQHWPLPDPAASGDLAVFEQVRDELQTRVAAM